jgi:hypothetical protein
MLTAGWLTALALAIQGGDERAVPRSLLEFVPAGTDVTLVADDAAELWKRAKASAWAEVLRAPDFAPLWKVVSAEFRAGWQSLDMRSEALLDAVHSAVFTADVGVAESTSLVVRLAPDSKEVGEQLRAALSQRAERTSHEGRELYSIGPSEEACFQWSEGFALVSAGSRAATLAAASELARRLESASPQDSLAARLGERRSSAPGALEVYVDLNGMLAEEKASAISNSEERALWQAFGLDGMGWLSFRLTLGEGAQSEVLTRIDLPSEGLLARWAACARQPVLELARYAPADAIEVAVLGYDAGSAWRALREVLAQDHPAMSKRLQAGLEASKAALGVDLETDLIAQLSGEFAEILLPAEPPKIAADEWFGMGVSPMLSSLSGIPGTSPGSAVVIGLRDTQALEGVIEALVEVAGTGEWIEDEQVGKRWMTSLAPPEVPWRPSWAFLDGALVVSLYAEPVRAILEQASEGAPPSWLDVEGHAASLGEFDEAFMTSHADLQRWLVDEIARPLGWFGALIHEADFGGHEPGESGGGKDLVTFADALPALIAQHLRGTMRAVAWIEGGSLRYRWWTR